MSNIGNYPCPNQGCRDVFKYRHQLKRHHKAQCKKPPPISHDKDLGYVKAADDTFMLRTDL